MAGAGRVAQQRKHHWRECLNWSSLSQPWCSPDRRLFPGQKTDVAAASLLWCEPTTDYALQSPGRWCLKRRCDKLCHWIEAVKRSHGQKRGLGRPIPLNTPARFSQSAKKLGKLGHLLQLGSTTSSTPAAGCQPPVPIALVPRIPQPGNPSCTSASFWQGPSVLPPRHAWATSKFANSDTHSNTDATGRQQQRWVFHIQTKLLAWIWDFPVTLLQEDGLAAARPFRPCLRELCPHPHCNITLCCLHVVSVFWCTDT